MCYVLIMDEITISYYIHSNISIRLSPHSEVYIIERSVMENMHGPVHVLLHRSSLAILGHLLSIYLVSTHSSVYSFKSPTGTVFRNPSSGSSTVAIHTFSPAHFLCSPVLVNSSSPTDTMVTRESYPFIICIPQVPGITFFLMCHF